MDFVTIKHPHPEVGDAQVPESAVDVWRRSGWLTEQEYAAQQEAEQAAGRPEDTAPKDDAAKTTSKPAGRSRRSTEES